MRPARGFVVSELSDRFKIKAPLRCDGIGRLDCAEDTESGQRMAVRWLPLDANGDAAVRACARLPEHPTLPRIRQTGSSGDKAFLAMDFPDGKLLSTQLGEPLSGEMMLEIGAQISDALATMHAQGVFHGELSAESVLLVPKGGAFLWDMPLVIANRLTDRRGEERLMHQLVRTAPFLPPERARGGGASAAADVYALAAVMCLSAGAPLPSGLSTLGVVHALANGSWSPRVPAVYHEPFRGMLVRMLANDESDRPSAREVADLLGKPAPAIPTIPEMPAIVLPKGFVMPSSALNFDRAAGFVAQTSPSAVASTRLATDEVEAVRTEAVVPPAQPAEALVDEAGALNPALATTSPSLPQVSAEPQGVALTENVSVSAELAEGAITFTAEEVRSLEAAQSIRPTLFIAAALLAVITVLLGVTVHLLRKGPEVQSLTVPAPARVLKAAPEVVVPASVEPAEDLDDDLALLAPLPKDGRPRPHNPSRRAAAPAKAVEAAPSGPEEFKFLETGSAPAAEKPELKRPQF